MSKRYSIAQARDQLPSLVRAAERGRPVEITRRGAPVAVLVSSAEWARAASNGDFWSHLQAFRREHEAELPEHDVFTGLRDKRPGRPFSL